MFHGPGTSGVPENRPVAGSNVTPEGTPGADSVTVWPCAATADVWTVTGVPAIVCRLAGAEIESGPAHSIAASAAAFGVPSPVTGSYPGCAANVSIPGIQALSPVETSLKSVANCAPAPPYSVGLMKPRRVSAQLAELCARATSAAHSGVDAEVP